MDIRFGTSDHPRSWFTLGQPPGLNDVLLQVQKGPHILQQHEEFLLGTVEDEHGFLTPQGTALQSSSDPAETARIGDVVGNQIVHRCGLARLREL